MPVRSGPRSRRADETRSGCEPLAERGELLCGELESVECVVLDGAEECAHLVEGGVEVAVTDAEEGSR